MRRDIRVSDFLGDVRDKERLNRAFYGVDYVIHAAALKQVPAAEYNPAEFIKTNIIGGMNVIDAALLNNVKRVVALSTDKACNPINLYGATKLCADKLNECYVIRQNLSEEKNFSEIDNGGRLCGEGFSYTSDNNPQKISIDELRIVLEQIVDDYSIEKSRWSMEDIPQ